MRLLWSKNNMLKTMRKITKSFCKIQCVLIVLIFSYSAISQTISKPTFAFTAACASSNYNTYPVDFNFSPATAFASGNIFYLQLSDAFGNFTNLTEVANSSTITTAPGQLTFLVPTNFIGAEGYKFRIRSTSPALLSPESNVVPIYYQIFTNSFYINNKQATAKYCSGSSITLSIDDPTAPPTSFTNLSYRWYKNNVVIAGAIATSLSINTPGTYYVEINYGSCSPISSITRSQDVMVTSVAGLQPVSISSSLGTNIGLGNPTTLSTVQNSTYAYQWFKNGILIIGATNFNYITDLAGEYYVNVSNINCAVQSNKIVLVNVKNDTATVIPNVISPNNDGINDTWIIPQQYIIGSNTEIVITDAVGKEVLKTKNYNNDWPTTTIDYKSVNPVYYYVISPISSDIKKGTITVIK